MRDADGKWKDERKHKQIITKEKSLCSCSAAEQRLQGVWLLLLLAQVEAMAGRGCSERETRTLASLKQRVAYMFP